MSFKQQSIQLIATDHQNKFYIPAPAKAFLSSITKPIAIVSIAGMYRTGKSYLVNRLLKTKQAGFRTGSSTQSVTKGLNVWGRPIAATDEQGNQFYYIVIDSEGIGSCEQEVKYDLKLLMLVFLISSTVVYNSMGAIDEQALDQLRVIVNLKSSLVQQAPREKTRLVWVLRDFALQLVDRNGAEITPDEYLEQCLQQVGGGSLQVRRKNEIRRAIREGLGRRSCFTLVRPTINQEQLADLSKCRLRGQFVGEIERVRQEVFGGSSADLKRINGHALNGRLLLGLLEECVGVLNGQGMPELSTIWQSVRTVAYEEGFEGLCGQVRAQVGRVGLPLAQEQLKLRLNQIENKYYARLQEQFVEVQAFKRYHRQFLRLLQRMNREVKRSNRQLCREKTMRELREFVKENVSLSSIQPTNLSLVRTVVDRMELKARGEPEGYEYVLSVLYDLMHVSEQKSIALHGQLCEYKRMVELGSLEQRNTSLTALALKRDYHEALKTINNLKVAQEDAEKQLAVARHQLEVAQLNAQNQQQQWDLREAGLLRQIEEGSFRARQRGEETLEVVKRLREENTELMGELSQLKEGKLREGLNERKELIFEEKMRETFDRFDEERRAMRAEADKLRKAQEALREKYEQERAFRERETEQYLRERQVFGGKQREFVEQIKQLKSMHAQAKKTYCATFDTIKDNDRILRSVENVALSSSKFTSNRKAANDDRETVLLKKFYEGQLQKAQTSHEESQRCLTEELERLRKLYEVQRARCSEGEMLLRGCREERQVLERELEAARERFADTVSEIESAKERERSLYEESIVRLLGNIDKREGGFTERREGVGQFSSYRKTGM